MNLTDTEYLNLLARSFPTAQAAQAAIAENRARLALPRPAELFVSDVHGEYEEFSHILRSGCGAIRRAIDAVFADDLPKQTKSNLAALVYYPEAKLKLAPTSHEGRAAWGDTSLRLLATLVGALASTRTQADLEALIASCAGAFAPTVKELLTSDLRGDHEGALLDATVAGIRAADCMDDVICALAHLAQRLVVGRLHLVGDVFDRGPAPDKIMDELMEYPAVDIEWGNHDIVWMGAALGQPGCIAHVVRNCARYANLSILTESYGINLDPLFDLARTAYADDPCAGFALKGDHPELSADELLLNERVQKAMAVIQFKVEARLIDENPGFGLEDRKLLHRVDWDEGTIELDGTVYAVTDTYFPTVDKADPYRLTGQEADVMESLQRAFQTCTKLQRHISFFLQAGSLYRVSNDTLMFHACVPLNPDGSFKEVELYGRTYKGRALFDAVDAMVRDAFFDCDPKVRKQGRDLLWYLWLGKGSPLFAKSKMATFEIYMIADKAARKEVKNPFYTLYDDPDVVTAILRDFGVDPERGRIVIGHVPVKVKKGEDPLKCGGKVIDIDGGMSKAYQGSTGIAGFTLVSDARGVTLYQHETFAGRTAAVAGRADLVSHARTVEQASAPLTVAGTDTGAWLEKRNHGLKQLVHAYRIGEMIERQK